ASSANAAVSDVAAATVIEPSRRAPDAAVVAGAAPVPSSPQPAASSAATHAATTAVVTRLLMRGRPLARGSGDRDLDDHARRLHGASVPRSRGRPPVHLASSPGGTHRPAVHRWVRLRPGRADG